MAGLLGMVFISAVGVNQDLYLYKTAEMLARADRNDQEFSHVSQISLQEHSGDATGAYRSPGLVDAPSQHHPEPRSS